MVPYESRAILPSLKRVLVDPERGSAKGDDGAEAHGMHSRILTICHFRQAHSLSTLCRANFRAVSKPISFFSRPKPELNRTSRFCVTNVPRLGGLV